MVSHDVLRAYADAWLAGDLEAVLLECWLCDEDQRFVDELWSRHG